MIRTVTALATLAVVATASVASASTVTYDFLSAANAGGGIGESIYSSFDTSSAFAGRNLNVTATVGAAPAFVYFDNGNAGMGVCGTPNGDGAAALNTATNAAGNLCAPGSDDGITKITEMLTFEATKATLIESISFNSNHDGGLTHALLSEWSINGVIYDADVDGTPTGGGNIRFDLGFILNAGDSFQVLSTVAPDSYISAVAVSAVPLPASFLLLGAAIGGLGFARRKSA